MKSSPDNRKKVELRDRFLRYVQAHTDERDRIPTVAELREALGVTNYMLLRCMNELIREGQLYRKSRKEGTFLSYHVKKHVVGLIDNALGGRQYVDDPAWFSGFFRAFTKNTDFVLRIVPCRKLEELPLVFRQYGLDSAVLHGTSGFKEPAHFPDCLPENIRKKLILVYSSPVDTAEPRPAFNAIEMDHDYWPREYVRAAARRGCRHFLILAKQNDPVTGIMLDEMKKRHLPWSPECQISDPDELPKKLPGLIRKYGIDAVRCAGGMQHSFALAVRNIPGFHPFFPLFGFENMYRQMQEEYPWLKASFLFEHLDDFYERLGFLSGKAAIELAGTGTPFPSRAVRLNYSDWYQAEQKRDER